MKHYDSIDNIKYNTELIGENVWAFNKLDGQNFCAKYNGKTKKFTNDFGSRKCMVDETSEQFGDTVRYFKEHGYDKILDEIISKHRGKKDVFCRIEEITFFFEWYGAHSFAGFHSDEDKQHMHLALIDVFLKKKGYIEPKIFVELFGDCGIEIPELIYSGKLNQEFIQSIQNNDWTEKGCKYPTVKEGVVIRRSTLLKGQRMPKVKVKTKWWLTELHNKYTDEECKLLE